MSMVWYTKENRAAVIKHYEKTDKDVEDYINIIREWLKTQLHLPEVPSDRLIEGFLMNNKFSIEITKQRLDMFYTIRSIIPDLFTNRQPKIMRMKNIPDEIYIIPLPQLTHDYNRVTLIHYASTEVDQEMEDIMAYHMNVSFIRILEDYQASNILLIDCSNISLHVWKKLNPVNIKKILMILEKVLSNRIFAMVYFNIPPFIDLFVNLIKQFLNPKIAKRIQMHKTIDTVPNDIIPREILPVEYGGKERSVLELSEMLKKKLDEHEDWFERLSTLRVDESLRPTILKNGDNFGFYGNFRKIDVD